MQTRADTPDHSPIHVFIVEDHTAVRRALSRMIRQATGFTLSGAAASAEDALAQLPNCKPPPDIALIDISLPNINGISLMHILYKKFPDLLCIVVSTYDGVQYAPKALRAGARGYLEKTALNRQSITEAIHQVHGGRIYLSERLKDALDR